MKMPRAGLIFAVLAVMANLGGTLAAASEPQTHPEMLVSTEWLAAHLQDPAVVILCVAEQPAFYTAGHIPGARWIALDRLVSQGETLNAIPPLPQLKELFESAGLQKDSRIVIYGEKQGMQAARAYFTLDYLGLAGHAALLDGGIEKWRAEARPESMAVPEVHRSSVELRTNPKVLVTFEQMREHAKRGDVALIDARPAAEYSGEKRSQDVPRSGHIPGAKGLYWMELLKSSTLPTLRPAEELRAAFQGAGAVPEREVVTYCRTGMQAAFDYFVAKYLGLKAGMYVSSFYEWSRREVPVEESPKPAAGPK